MSTLKVMDHNQYPKTLKSKDDSTLRFIIAQCRHLIGLQKDFNPNIGYYEDEILYCSQELHRRSLDGKRKTA